MNEMHGHVTNVTGELHGDELTVAATTSTYVLSVIDTADFDEDGGMVRLDDGTNGGLGTLREYVGITDGPPAVTLAAPPAVALAVGTRVDVWDTDANEPVVEYVADVVDDVAGDLVQATVEHALVSLLQSAVRAGTAESVICRLDTDGRWTVAEVLGRTPVIDGVTFQTATDGERIVIRNDGGAGVIEAWSGIAGEIEPGRINPLVYLPGVLDRPGVELTSGTRAGVTDSALVRLYSGDAANDGSAVSLKAAAVLIEGVGDGDGYIQLFAGSGGVLIPNGTLRVDLPVVLDGESWTAATISSPWSAVASQPLEYRRDAANNLHISGAVNRNTATSGSAVFILPTGYRPTRTLYRPARAPVAGLEVYIEINTGGAVRVAWFGTAPASAGIDVCVSLA